MRLALGQVLPDEYHGRARCCGKYNEAGNIAVDLIGRQIRPEQPAIEQPAQQHHRERLHCPVDEQRRADAAPVAADLAQPQAGKDKPPPLGWAEENAVKLFRTTSISYLVPKV